jgi:uncharacterized cupin superfamily protein
VSEPRPNFNEPVWEREIDEGPFAFRAARLGAAAGAEQLGATVYEIPPGRRNMPYHAHHGIEELIVVLRGTPTLRSPEGERELAEGELVACPRGAAGAHQLINNTEEPVRVLVASSKAAADFVVYPDSGKLAAMSGEWGSPDQFRKILSLEAELGYFEGELD